MFESLESRRLFAVSANLSAKGSLEVVPGLNAFGLFHDDTIVLTRVSVDAAVELVRNQPPGFAQPEGDYVTGAILSQSVVGLLNPGSGTDYARGAFGFDFAGGNVNWNFNENYIREKLTTLANGGELVGIRAIGGGSTSQAFGPTGDLFFAPASGLRHLHIDAGSGNDTISITPNVKASATLLGGAGNDTIVGGSMSDHLSGGSGNDTLIARGIGAILEGGQGDDILAGSKTAADSLYGGAGRDTLDGGDSSFTTTPGTTTPGTNPGTDIGTDIPLGRATTGASGVTIRGTFADFLDGGEETDTAKRDDADTRVSIEILI